MSMSVEQGAEQQLLSIVIPIYDEAATLPELYRRLMHMLSQDLSELAYEIVFVNDGSTDGGIQILVSLQADNPAVKVVNLSRNFGHQAAITAGLDYAKGNAVICMDGDLQDPPEIIPTFVARWRDGNDVVYAVRKARKESFIKRACYAAFYRLLRRLSMVSIPIDSGDFALMDRRVVDCLKAIPERSRFIRGLRTWIGFRQIGVGYERERRFAGTSKYTWSKLMKLAVNGLLSFSAIPLRLVTALGFLISCCSLLGIMVALYFRLFTAKAMPGWTTTIIPILLLGGVQLLSIGVLGEYIAQIFDEVKQRPVYLVDSILDSGENAPLRTWRVTTQLDVRPGHPETDGQPPLGR
jgi:glycosyltransferase involved in cell wall biosynthesis